MSHLARVINYREHLTSLGVTCAIAQSELCQEAYIRAIIANHARFHGDLEIHEEEENSLWNQLDKWNSVSPIKARLILESVKVRLARIRQHLTATGVVPTNDEFDVKGTIKEVSDGVEVERNICVTDNEAFKNLVEYLGEELRAGHE